MGSRVPLPENVPSRFVPPASRLVFYEDAIPRSGEFASVAACFDCVQDRSFPCALPISSGQFSKTQVTVAGAAGNSCPSTAQPLRDAALGHAVFAHGRGGSLGEQLLYHLAVDVRQSKISTLKAKRQFEVIETQQV